MRAIALLEAMKGLLALFIAAAAVTLMPHNLPRLSAFLSTYARLHPDGHVAAHLLRWLAQWPAASTPVALAATAYSCVGFTESWGLWQQCAWAASWVSCRPRFTPFVVRHALRRPGLGAGVVLASNIALVAFLLMSLARRRRGQV